MQGGRVTDFHSRTILAIIPICRAATDVLGKGHLTALKEKGIEKGLMGKKTLRRLLNPDYYYEPPSLFPFVLWLLCWIVRV